MGNQRKIFGTSLPKSGTHLLSHVFSDLGFQTSPCHKDANKVGHLTEDVKNARSDIYAYGHWRYESQHISQLLEFGFKVIVLLRDPRDVCLSMVDFYQSGRPEKLHAMNPELQLMDRRRLIDCVIRGVQLSNTELYPIKTLCNGWLEWTELGGSILRYEDLEESVRQSKPIESMEEFNIDPIEFLHALKQNFGCSRSATFNKGQSKRWETEFNEELRQAWKQEAYGVATLFGFEEC